MRVVPIVHSFNGGEISPLMYGRTDQDKYHSSCKTLLNFIPTVQGPATRRGGTRYTGTVKDQTARTWFATFRFSLLQNYTLEFGNNYIRFWTNRGQLLNGGSPYEVVSPWATSDLVTANGTFALRFDQSGDVLWITNVNGTFAPYTLSRFGATNFVLAKVTFPDGPFQGVNLQNTVTMQVSGSTGAVTVTASAATFSASDVGTSLYLESQNPAVYPAWQTNKVYAANSYVSNGGNVYFTTTAGGTSGATPPTHVRGSANDGGVVWQYLHSGYGVVQITGYTDSQHVTGTVLSAWQTSAQPTALPLDVTAAGYGGVSTTTRWSLSLFSATRGWPNDVKFFRSRLCYIGGNWLCASQSGVYNSFTLLDGPDALETCAIILQLPVEALTWIAPSLALLVGTPSAERSIQEQSTSKVFAADNVKDQAETKYGAWPLETTAITNNVLFVQRTGQRVRELSFDFLTNRYKGDDLTVLAEHIFNGKYVVQTAWQQEPDTLFWCLLSDGTLGALTYNRERGVIAWARHQIGGNGFVESIAVIPSPDGRKDDLWLIVRRTINGVTKRYVEYMEDRKLYQTGTQNSFYVDAGITYSGAATTVITGLSHLEGATVDVLIDGGATSPLTVSGGQITLPRSGSTVQIGFNVTSVLCPLSIDAGAQDGTAQSRSKAISLLYVRLVDTIGGSAGPSLSKLDSLAVIDLAPPLGLAPTLVSGDASIQWDSGFPDTQADIYVVQNQPLPMTVVALMPRLQVND